MTETTLLEDLESLIGDFQRDKISQKEVVEILKNIVEYETKQEREQHEKKICNK